MVRIIDSRFSFSEKYQSSAQTKQGPDLRVPAAGYLEREDFLSLDIQEANDEGYMLSLINSGDHGKMEKH